VGCGQQKESPKRLRVWLDAVPCRLFELLCVKLSQGLVRCGLHHYRAELSLYCYDIAAHDVQYDGFAVLLQGQGLDDLDFVHIDNTVRTGSGFTSFFIYSFQGVLHRHSATEFQLKQHSHLCLRVAQDCLHGANLCLCRRAPNEQ